MDDYYWDMTRAVVRRDPKKVPRRKAIGRLLTRFLLALIGVLLISAAYQYVIWLNGPDEIIRALSYFEYPSGQARKQLE